MNNYKISKKKQKSLLYKKKYKKQKKTIKKTIKKLNKQNGGSKICKMVKINNIKSSKEPLDDKKKTLTIYTTGLAYVEESKINASDNFHLAEFYLAILKSAIDLSIPKSPVITEINITHFDKHFNTNKITQLEDNSQNTIDSRITSKIEKNFLTHADIDNKEFLDYPHIILDFAHMENGDDTSIGFITNNTKYVNTVYQPTKFNCIYFGFYDNHEPENEKYFDIIRKCKFFTIDADGKFESYRDRGIIRGVGVNRKITGNIFGNDPSIFSSLYDCASTKSVITIPGLRTQEQFGGLDAKFIYNDILWSKTAEQIQTYIVEENKILATSLFIKRKHYFSNPIKDKCLLCVELNCNNFESSINNGKSPLCNSCYNLLTKEQILDYIKGRNPKPYNG